MGIIIAFIIIGIIIFFHELGHYIFAKKAKCGVLTFAIGWGPKILSFKRKETEYKINALPMIGGYVNIYGLEEEKTEASEEKEQIQMIKKCKLKDFSDVSTWNKIQIFLGGVFIQLLLCVAILTIFTNIMGFPITGVAINKVFPSSPAELAKLQPGDVIVDINEYKIKSVEQMIDIIEHSENRFIDITIRRNNEIILKSVKPEFNEEFNKVTIGVSISPALYYSKEKGNLWNRLIGGIVLTGKLTKTMLIGIQKLITGQLPLSMIKGPIGIIDITQEVARTGINNLIMLFAIINLNLAIINSLPFPALDGGHMLILLIEKFFNIKVKPKIKRVINTIGLVILLSLILYVSINDILGLKSKYFNTSKIKTQMVDKDVYLK